MYTARLVSGQVWLLSIEMSGCLHCVKGRLEALHLQAFLILFLFSPSLVCDKQAPPRLTKFPEPGHGMIRGGDWSASWVKKASSQNSSSTQDLRM